MHIFSIKEIIVTLHMSSFLIKPILSTVSLCCNVCALCAKGSRRSDEEALEEQVRKLGEELREVRELNETEQDKTRGNEEELLQLHNQVKQPCVCIMYVHVSQRFR